MTEKIKKNYFSFGCGQKHKNCYIVIEGDPEEAREKMFKKFGSEWCFQYTEEQWNNKINPVTGEKCSQAELYSLKEIF